MPQVRQTAKFIVRRWSDYRLLADASGRQRHGPADTYYSKADFSRTAAHYGWGDASDPNRPVVDQFGDGMTLFDALSDALIPVRIRYL